MKRDTTGKFVPTWESETKQRVSITLTATAWQLLDEAAQTLGTSRSEVIERVARSLDSRLPHFAAAPTNGQGAHNGLDDCAELAQASADQQVTAVLESISDAFVAFDRDWRYTYVNQAAVRLLGRDPDDLLGKNVWTDVFPELVGKQAYHELHRAVAQQVPVSWQEWGEPVGRWLEVNAYPSTEGIAVYFRDITERKQAEQEIKSVNASLKLALSAADLGTWDLNLINDTTRRSLRHDQIFGYETLQPEWGREVAKRHILPEDHARFDQLFQQALETGELRLEVRIVWPDGSLHWINALGRVYYGEHRRPMRMAGVIMDITERKQAEEDRQRAAAEREHLLHALQRERARLETILQQMPAGVFIADATSDDVVLTNDQARQLTGYNFDRAMSPESFDEVVPFRAFHLNGRQYEPHEYPLVRSLRQGELVTDEEMKLVRRDGSCVYISANSTPIWDAQGQIEAAVVVFQDVTGRRQAADDLRRSAERLSLALAAAKLGDWSWDAATDTVTFSDRAADIFGVRPGPNLTWTEIQGLIYDGDRERARAGVEQAIADRSDYDIEYRVVRPDGLRRWVAAKGRAQYDASGQVLGMLGVVQDISDRKHVEESLHQREEQLRLAISAARMVAWAWDASTNQMVRSEAACDILGLSPETLNGSGEDGWNLVHPDDLPAHQARVAAAIAQAGSYSSEVRMIRPSDGAEIWVEDRGQVTCDDQGQVLNVEGVLFDITARKKAEEALRLSEERFRTLANAVPQLMWVNAADGTAEFFNQPWLDYTGATLASSLKLWPQIIHPEDAQSVMPLRAQAIQAGRPYEMEVRLRRADQVYRWHLARVVPLKDDQGRVLQWFGTATDIHGVKQTEDALRESEERLRLALNAGQMGAWEWNLETNVQRWDVNQYKLFGMDQDQLSAEAFFELIHPDDAPAAQALTQQVLAHNGSFQTEFRIRRPDGQVRWLSSQGMVVQGDTPAARRLIGVNFDITERKQAEAERERLLASERAARQEAEAANRIKDEFLAVLSHELRSPLNPILGWAKLLQSRQFDPAGQKQALETIERNAKLQAQLIDDLLDVSRILRNKLVLNPCPVDLVPVIEAALETVRLAADAKGLAIQKALTAGIGLVMGDAGRLQQVIWNLLSNAVKFTPTGGQITIALDRIPPAPSAPALPDPPDGSPADLHLSPTLAYAQITVTDTGKGISPEFLPHVFDYFRQEDGTTTRRFGGLGLGLAIVRYLTEMQGGTVSADSPGEGQGATFRVRLPLIRQASPDPVEVPERPVRLPEVRLSGLRVLAVDDEPDMRDLILTVLEQSGAEARVVDSAAAALTALPAFSPDILISDIGMPDQDGYMLMRQVRQLRVDQGGQVPAIALTAYAAEYDQQQALAVGFQQHIAKPVEPEVLVKAVATLLGRE